MPHHTSPATVALKIRNGGGYALKDPLIIDNITVGYVLGFVVDIQDLQLEGGDLISQEAEGFRPRKDVPPWPFKLPLEWGADPFKDRNWRFHLSAWRMLDPFIREYSKTQDASFLERTLPIVLDWHRFHIEKQYNHRYAWYDMSVGQRAARLAFLMERISRGIFSVTDQQNENLQAIADAHFNELMKPEKIAPNNHGIFQALGLKLLSMVVEGRQEASLFADDLFTKIMDAQYTEQGVHTENSPDYHFFMQRTLLNSGVDRHMGDPFRGKGDAVEAVKPWLVFPNGEIARVGDSNGRSNPLSKDPEPVFCAGQSYAVADLTKSGYAIVRSMPSTPQHSMLFVTGMAHNLDHKHADELSFELFEQGQFVFVDTGKYGYKSGPMREHVLSADAHNTISLRDNKFGPENVELEGSLLQPIAVNDGGFIIEGRVLRPGLFEQCRNIQYIPGSSIIITDRVEAEVAKDFVSSLHLAPGIALYPRKDGFDAVVGKKLMRVDLVATNFEIEIKNGSANPLQGWHCQGYLEMIPIPVVRAICRGVTVEIEWRIRFTDIFDATNSAQ